MLFSRVKVYQEVHKSFSNKLCELLCVNTLQYVKCILMETILPQHFGDFFVSFFSLFLYLRSDLLLEGILQEQ